MNLELASFRVTDVRFGASTVLRDGVLWLDRESLAAHLREDSRLARVGIEVARPGESIRIIHVLDAVEPRIKVAGAPTSLGSWDGPSWWAPDAPIGWTAWPS